MRSIRKLMSMVILLGFVAICLLNSFAHSGRTDSNGGHRDNKNKSGLGSYHYHHGYGPHLHPNGVCPYEEKQEVTSPAKEEKKEITPAKEEKLEHQIVAVESVRIDSQNNITLDINEKLTLNAVVNPSEAANKHVTWSSSDTSVATVNNMGVITALSAGDTVITATADNGEKDSITLTINEVIKITDKNYLLKERVDEVPDEQKLLTEPEQLDSIHSLDTIVSNGKSLDNKDEESNGLTKGLGITGAVIAFLAYNALKKKKK
jgi:hypothetical protein